MRLLLGCFLLFLLDAEVQKAQIVQTYVYQPQNGEFTQELKNGKVQLSIHSKALLEFMNSNHPENNIEKQVVRFNNTYTEFKSSSKIIHDYTNALNERLNFNLSYMIYALEYLNRSTFMVKNISKPIRNLEQCNFLIQKTLTSLINGNKDFVINLDNQYYFSKVLSTSKILRCVK